MYADWTLFPKTIDCVRLVMLGCAAFLLRKWGCNQLKRPKTNRPSIPVNLKAPKRFNSCHDTQWSVALKSQTHAHWFDLARSHSLWWASPTIGLSITAITIVTHCPKSRGDNGLLTILTSDTMSMLAISIFIPTPTGGPGQMKTSTHKKEDCTSDVARVIRWHIG